MQRITFVLCDNMLATSTTLPIEMLRAAETFARVNSPQRESLHIQTAAVSLEPVTTRAGIKLYPDKTLDEVIETDLIFLPALWRNPRPIIKRSHTLCNWLKRAYEDGCTISSVGTGVCFLAEAGLLHDKPATTHWHYFDQFQTSYPNIQLKRQYFITQAGNLYCSASVNALADLTVHFIQRIYNRTVANHVERHFSHEIRQSYESTGYFEGKTNSHPDEDIVQAQIWMQDNYGKEIRLSDVAERFEMSVRTFNRRFKNATGKSPLQYLQEVRMETARDLLKTSNLSISEIAYKVGYSDMGHFTGLFKKLMATTPSEYRTTVRAKLFSAEPF
ncbi:GlxA family transcriptional regulator [Marinibactrum halimedae]|uniref:AraC family transcriptional regulator n=1 Tax=Marinibactrum halimedae TaxID=1444977 RepID=A0AA37WN45_9GAMM|nr:helix-turn-helix domain-containing protein [Marinibactrum halimedae]MCD9459860.1 helix-turn-helix domain-containing protein [Marinibactrum halimedae]GLS26945.1 AraC family transcriptional regulator [Marinibactrum halimedae]